MLLSSGEEYRIEHTDCITGMAELPDKCVDFSIFSPPFFSVYSYQSDEADIGNSDEPPEAKLHMLFFYRQLVRIIKPGRCVVVHVQQIPRLKKTGKSGLFDFRGFNIKLAERCGLIFQNDWLIRKNPQSQSLRTKAHELSFSGLESDRARSRPALADYLLKFRAPGENKVPVLSNDVSRDDWIRFAETAWTDIRETDTLNLSEGRHPDDVKHICALQLEPIRRCVLMYSNPGEIVFSPFAGIGSELYVSLLNFRRAFGFELKKSYYEAALVNCERAIKKRETVNMLDFQEAI